MSPFTPENVVSRDRFGRPVPCQPAHSLLTVDLVLTQKIAPYVAAVSIYIYHHTPSGQSRLYRVTQLRTDGVHCREIVVSKHNSVCTAAVHTVDPFFPPDLRLYKRKEFSIHSTISCVVFHNLPVVITAVL